MGRKREQEQGQYTEFASRFVEAMDDCGLPLADNSYKTIGSRFGVSGTTVGNWVNGDKLPSMDTAIEISLKSGRCVEWLLTGRGPTKPSVAIDPEAVPYIEEILKLYQTLDEDSWRHIVAGMKGFAEGKIE